MKMNFLILLIIIYSTECRNLMSNKTNANHNYVNNTLLMNHNNMLTPIISDNLIFDTRNMDEDELQFFLNLDKSDDSLQDLSEESSGDFETSGRNSPNRVAPPRRRRPKGRQSRPSRPSRPRDSNFGPLQPQPSLDNDVSYDSDGGPGDTQRHDITDTVYVPNEVRPAKIPRPKLVAPIVMDKGWIQYKYDKSFMLMNVTANRFEAERICEAFNKNSDVGAELAVPQSEDEMHFLYYYLFSLSHAMKNVWIGQNTENYRNVSFEYTLYANWAKGMPTLTKPCIQIRSPYTIYADMEGNVGGKWEDVSCHRKNLVLCQKPQHWSEHQFIRILTELKKDVEGFKRKLAMNTIPPGFIYIQMPNQTSPQRLWPRYEWKDVSDKYAGLFFRVLGGNSGEFGQIQEGSSPKLSGYRSFGNHGVPHEDLKTHEIQPDNKWTGSRREVSANGYPVSFKMSSEEVKPRNMAIKIWKRVEHSF